MRVGNRCPGLGLAIDDPDICRLVAVFQKTTGVGRIAFNVAVGSGSAVDENFKHRKRVCDSLWGYDAERL